MAGTSSAVAIVDDDLRVARALRRLVRTLGHEAEVFQSGNALFCEAGTLQPSHALIDLHMPGTSGAALVARVHARWPNALILVMSGLETEGAAEACRAAGAMLLVKKPLQVEDLERFFDSSNTPPD
jgi:FixJ family two-component response regulator